jgi:hypothetical protein
MEEFRARLIRKTDKKKLIIAFKDKNVLEASKKLKAYKKKYDIEELIQIYSFERLKKEKSEAVRLQNSSK